MSGLLENIGNILISIIIWLGQITNALIQNPIFIILMAVILFKLIYELIRKIIDIKNIEKMPYMNIDNYDVEYEEWKNNYSQNAKDMEEEEYNDFLDSIM